MRFEKISKEQYLHDNVDMDIFYEHIKLPKRATQMSAGYDIYSVRDFTLQPGQTVKLPTGIRVKLDSDKFLAIVPRSGLGFKYRTQLDNTIGIIDADYYNSSNEGHIWVKITNDSKKGDVLEIKQGDAICQGIICQYFLTEDDNVTETRDGGFGSTDKK